MQMPSRIGPFSQPESQPEERAVPAQETARTVLVVEDDRAVSSLLVDLLHDRGYHAVPAYDGRRALALARKLKPHLITLDLALPGSTATRCSNGSRLDPGTARSRSW